MRPASLLLVFSIMGVCTMSAPGQGNVELAGKPAQRFSTTGHAKSKGAKISIRYPATWKALEDERPNIVQKFKAPESNNIVMIMTKSLPPPALSKAEIEEAFADKGTISDILGEGVKITSYKATKLEDEPAAMVEYVAELERAGEQFSTRTLVTLFIRGQTLVIIQCMTGISAGSPEQRDKAFEAMRPMFQAIITSTVFEDKWK